jgi:hypothetical protein
MNGRIVIASAVVVVAISSIWCINLTAQESPHAMPPGMTHEEHARQVQREADMKARGSAVMGFDQETTVHHFVLRPDGGAIEVEVKNDEDEQGREQVRAHLRAIAREFAAGEFVRPFATHGEEPSGVAVMKARRGEIKYVFEPTRAGGRVRLVTSDRAARTAIHEFLRYQIREHKTGDALTIAR